MRLYNRKIVDRAIFSRIDSKREFSEGILWSIDTESETCTVKLQGSNEQVRAHYPQNLKTIPEWLRVGNAIRVSHKQGKRNYLEVMGPGRAVPNPVTGNQFPTLTTLPNTLLTPVYVTPLVPGSNTVLIADGVSYRIGGITYALQGGTGDFFIMDTDAASLGPIDTYPFAIMDQVAIPLNPNPASGYFRYDMLVGGIDGNPDVIEGAEVTSSPSLPSVPANHIFLEKILRVGGETGVTQIRIGQTWAARSPKSLVITADEQLVWNETTDYPESDLTLTVYDQYGSPLANSAGWQFQCDLVYGTGQVYSADSGYGNSVTQNTIGSSYTFKYQRNQLVGERHPITMFTLNSTPPLVTSIKQQLYDEFGNLIGGSFGG